MQAHDVIERAQKKGVKLAVGHVERFNPAVRKLREVIREGWLGTPIHFAFTRVGGYPETILEGNNVLLEEHVPDGEDAMRSPPFSSRNVRSKSRPRELRNLRRSRRPRSCRP